MGREKRQKKSRKERRSVQLWKTFAAGTEHVHKCPSTHPVYVCIRDRLTHQSYYTNYVSREECEILWSCAKCKC